MTFAHTGASYARGFSRAYHKRLNRSDCSDSMTIPAQTGMCNYSGEYDLRKAFACDTLCDWTASGPAVTPRVAGGLVSSAPTAWRRACRPTWTPRASRGSASPCQHRTRVSSSAVPSKDTRQSRSLLASTQSATAPSTHRDSGPTERYACHDAQKTDHPNPFCLLRNLHCLQPCLLVSSLLEATNCKSVFSMNLGQKWVC